MCQCTFSLNAPTGSASRKMAEGLQRVSALCRKHVARLTATCLHMFHSHLVNCPHLIDSDYYSD